MSESWQSLKKRLLELQKSAPSPLIVELIYFDESSEELTVEEAIKRDFQKCMSFKVVKGNNLKEASELLKWIAPNCCIK